MKSDTQNKIDFFFIITIAAFVACSYFFYVGDILALVESEHLIKVINMELAPQHNIAPTVILFFGAIISVLLTFAVESIYKTKLMNIRLVSTLLKPIIKTRTTLGKTKSWIVLAPLLTSILLFSAMLPLAIIIISSQLINTNNQFNVTDSYHILQGLYTLANAGLVVFITGFFFLKPLCPDNSLDNKRALLITHAAIATPIIVLAIYNKLFSPMLNFFYSGSIEEKSDPVHMVAIVLTTTMVILFLSVALFKRAQYKKNFLVFGLLPYTLSLIFSVIFIQALHSLLQPYTTILTAQSTLQAVDGNTHLRIKDKDVIVSNVSFGTVKDSILLAYTGSFGVRNPPRYIELSASFKGNEEQSIQLIATVAKGFSDKAKPILLSMWEKQPLELLPTDLINFTLFAMATKNIDWASNEKLLSLALEKDYQGYLDLYQSTYLNRLSPPKTNILKTKDEDYSFRLGDRVPSIISRLIVRGNLATLHSENTPKWVIEQFNKEVEKLSRYEDAFDSKELVDDFNDLIEILEIH